MAMVLTSELINSIKNFSEAATLNCNRYHLSAAPGIYCQLLEKMAVWDSILSQDYEAQHFGFHPRTFIDKIYNVLFENITSSLRQLKKHLIQEYKDVPCNVIIQNTDSLLQDLIKLCDKSIDKLEVYSNSNIFCIKPNAVLPEDRIHVTKPCTEEEDKNIDEEIEELKKRILEEKFKRFMLRKNIAEQKMVKERLLQLQNELKHFLKIASDHGVTKENIESLYSNIDVLSREIVPELSTME